MRWRLSDKYEPAARALAERHYTRQTPGAAGFLRPGHNYVLLTEDARAVWATWSGLASHAWAGAPDAALWECEPLEV